MEDTPTKENQMPKHIDKLEKSVGEFNENYVKVDKIIREQLEKETEDIPQIHQVLDMLHSLDAVLDDLVTTIKKIDRENKKP